MATLVAEREYFNEFPYTFSFILGPAYAANGSLNCGAQLSADCSVNSNKFPYTFSFILGPVGNIKYLEPASISVLVSLPAAALRKTKSNASSLVVASASSSASVEHIKAGFFTPFFYAGGSSY